MYVLCMYESECMLCNNIIVLGNITIIILYMKIHVCSMSYMANVKICYRVLCLPERIYIDNEKNMTLKYVRMYCFIVVTLTSSPYIFCFHCFVWIVCSVKR